MAQTWQVNRRGVAGRQRGVLELECLRLRAGLPALAPKHAYERLSDPHPDRIHPCRITPRLTPLFLSVDPDSGVIHSTLERMYCPDATFLGQLAELLRPSGILFGLLLARWAPGYG